MLFQVDGILETVFAYGQMISLFLVFVVVEGFVAAKSESPWPGIVFIGIIFALAVGMGLYFHDLSFFGFMMVPVALCFLAFFLSRKNRAKNIEKGLHYNEEGLLEEELKDMQKS